MRPNIVEIIWHDLGDWLGCYGRSDVASPALDRFAAGSALLANHFCTAPQCSPSRASLKTGRYPQSHGVMGLTHRGWRYHDGEHDLPALLGAAGYRTALVGFQHEHHAPAELTYQSASAIFADARGQAQELPAAAVADQAIAWLEEAAAGPQDTPFYLSAGFFDVHRIYGVEYDPATARSLEVPGFLPDEPVVRRDMAAFYGRIRSADAAVGRVLDAVERLGLEGNTIVYFTTDHGPEFPRAKMTLYDPGIRVAFLCRWPGVIRPGRVEALTSHIDVAPALLEAAGAPIPANMQGRSLLPLLRGEAPSARDAVFAQMTWHGGEYDPMRCIRTGSHKYIRNFQPGWPVQIGGAYTQRYGEPFIVRHFARPRPDEELYDLAVDPWEAQNLAGRPELRDLQTELASRLTAWMEAVADPLLLGPVPFPDPARTGSGCVWVKAPPHDPAAEPFRWDVLRTRDFGELPLPEPNDA